MVREIDTSQPLSPEDIEYLRTRHSDAYVERMILLAGESTGSPASEGGEGEGEGGQKPPAQPQGQPDPSEAENGAQSDPGEDNEDDDEDLIGGGDPEGEPEEGIVEDGYNPFDHTTREVRAYMKATTPTERERVRQVEMSRTDGVDPRTSITNYDPS